MKTELVRLKPQDSNVTIDVLSDTQYVIDFEKNPNGEEHTVTLEFNTSNVVAELISLYRLKNGEFVNLTTVTHHKVPHTSCNTKIKGVLFDNTKSIYIGKILIDKKAQQTSSFLHDAKLILGVNTNNRSDPVLEIEANDVQASHGATTGRIDDISTFYLQSRGLNKSEAQDLIVDGFYESLLSEIKDATIKEELALKLKS